MIIKEIKISPRTEYKINTKHSVNFKEIKSILLNPLHVQRIKENIFMAIGSEMRYLTIIFSYNKKFKSATIKTAYPSQDWQIKLYRRKIKK